MMTHTHTNRLAHSTSPYLLQHAHNPVDWFEWSSEALEKSKTENKPILVSIGYSSCHWCHVMERESFENEEIAAVMNERFVCIKVDREERPDIDQIYMEAVQALGVNGGWPLNVFLTSDQIPFFGGTYFSPQAWTQVLINISRAYVANKDQVDVTATEMRNHLLQSDVKRFVQHSPASTLNSDLDQIYAKLSTHFDTKWGGMDRAPKFVMPSIWRFLLRYHHLTNNNEALNQVVLTLDKISQGGIYDQIRGGFARYSVDGFWFAPHFEKMLYDNAQLMSLYAEAYAVTGKQTYRQVVNETFAWITAEMTHPDGGFYSALDADSEGIEGKFYVWKKQELISELGETEPLISDYFDAVPEGNWEHGYNILNQRTTEETFLEEHQFSKAEWDKILSESKAKLLSAREKRIKPALDDKILTAWNAMMTCGLIDAYTYLKDVAYLDTAIRNMKFITSKLADGVVLYRSFKEKRSRTPGFLDDYAYCIQAMIKLYQATFQEEWLNHANALAVYVCDNFYDSSEHFFYYTSLAAEKMISRKKEIFDNVIPSSNAIMAQNLFLLGTILDKDSWKAMAMQMTSALANLVRSEPNYMSQWATVHTEVKAGLKEVILIGDGVAELSRELQEQFNPFVTVLGSEGTSALPLLQGKVALAGKATIYVCENKTCKLPVHTVGEAKEQIAL